MTTTYSIHKTLLILIIACSMLLLLANIRLSMQLSKYRRDYQNTINANQPRAGMIVPPLVGYDLNGDKLAIGYGKDSQKTLILALSPSCHACDDNWPQWQRLIASEHAKGVRIVLADIATNEPPLSKAYVTQHGIGSLPVLAEVTAESMIAYHLQYTPQTILVDQTGKVEKVQSGAISSGEFENLLATSTFPCANKNSAEIAPCSVSQLQPVPVSASH